jgi:hypothetical protein
VILKGEPVSLAGASAMSRRGVGHGLWGSLGADGTKCREKALRFLCAALRAANLIGGLVGLLQHFEPFFAFLALILIDGHRGLLSCLGCAKSISEPGDKRNRHVSKGSVWIQADPLPACCGRTHSRLIIVKVLDS